jgi:hypothetical protein
VSAGGAAAAGKGAPPEVGGAGDAPDDAEDGDARLGADCTADAEARTCNADDPRGLVRCKDGIWTYSSTCALDERCDRTLGECVALDAHCFEVASSGPLCEGNTVLDCGPDVWTAGVQVCPYGCRDGACVPGSEGELTLHTGLVPPHLAWDDPISVCLAAGAADDAESVAWVRSEVERTYSRFFAIDFSGWQACKPRATGVVLSFADACRGSLVNDLGLVEPAPNAVVPVTLCRSIAGAKGAPAPVSESLLRLLARHQFGHVLGLADGVDPAQTGMLRGVVLGQEDAVVLTAGDYESLSDDGHGYGRKPSASLVTPSGACLTATELEAGRAEPAGTVGATACRALVQQHFRPASTEIQNGDATKCFEAPAAVGDPITVADCALARAAQSFLLPRAEWRTPTLCMAPERPPGQGQKLVSEPCAQLGDPSQAWFFEIVDRKSTDSDLRARIHFADSNLCAAPLRDKPVLNDPLVLSPCTSGADPDDVQIFRLRADGSLGAGETLLVHWQDPAGLLYFGSGSGDRATFFVSGALLAGDGSALTLASGASLVLSPLGAPPTPAQTFDVYF